MLTAGNIRGAIFVKMSWGVKDLDREEVDLWDPSKMGKLIWDETFTVIPESNQQALLDLCTDLRDN